MKFFATAPRGLSPLLERELRELGAEKIRPSAAGATFEGELELAYRLCLWSRVANRVLLPITTLKAATPEELYEEVKAIHWEKHLHSSGTLAVDCAVSDAAIGHSKYAALKVKDAVCDRFREQFDERPSVELDTPDLRINLHLRGTTGKINIDLSGGSLHRRGYRAEGVIAPLKENLAAGILLLADWPFVASRGGALLDPMCGSGTLLIEGAMIAADIAPGLYRKHIGFTGWRRHDEALWQRLLDEAAERRTAGLQKLPPILGFDANPQAIAAALRNIDSAGLSRHIQIERRELGTLPRPGDDTPGLLVVNPPYGERLGEINELKGLYAELGRHLQSDLPGWRAAIFTGNPQLAAYVGLRTHKKPEPLFNGPIECQLFLYRIPETTKATEENQINPTLAHSEGAQMFANRLRKNLKHLGKWARREGVDCYRLYDSDLPEYAVAVDLYQGDKLWVHVQEYQAPKTVDEEKARQRLMEALAVIPQVLEIPVEQLFYKVRQRQKGASQYEKQASRGAFFEVREGSCRLLVNLSDYLDTGLFLDHRTTRTLIEREAKGRRFLNLFAYTGVATLHAAAGGARSTTTVDMSHTYLDWAKRNMALNAYTGPEHHYIQADCTAWLAEQAPRAGGQYDLIFLDPPTFSSSKRMEDAFDVQRDHVALITNAMRLLSKEGLLIFSNNFRKFRLDEAALGNYRIEEISRQTLPEDFRRNPHIHRCWRIHH
ncbi:MAG: bifunctional 23S rRNA (guanine(2069)-N(7))-methyltransferase RlmK/23S rRNA (guanine(2445)-N(2))-methyltransferase RlmL [Gammaproteobacteria bacterium]|nr:bifunctional 23S rRNA (guanine(2069)-N(7))-methyltransferase RlmK/23S rRNA (guanine(2445)-N(2))-methyltransferase RlmL [Gammaproteobacteria bacterium]